MEEFDLDSLKRKVLRKYPAFGPIISSVKYDIVDNSSGFSTAGTNGKLIRFNKDYMSTLPENEQIFVFAHEICHIALEHLERRKDKDPMLWNIATDAIINKNLEQDGLTIPEGGVNIADAINYDSEELYEKLLKEKQEKEKQQQSNQNKNNNGKGDSQQQQQSGQQQQQQNGQKQHQQNGQQQQSDQNKDDKNNSQQQNNQQQQQDGQKQNEPYQNAGHDDHGMWDEQEKEEKDDKNNKKDKKDDKKSENNKDEQNGNDKQNKKIISEKKVFQENRELVEEMAKEVLENLGSQVRGIGGESHLESIGSVGSAKHPVVNWKKLLRKELEFEDERWGHKFSDKGNNYAARLEDYEYEETAQTEIILDTSGSVSEELLKSFLRQIKTILPHSKIKVATFSDCFHNDWKEINSASDIDNMRIRIGGGTDFDGASRAFSKDPRVNKICFTDGCDGGHAGIVNERKDIIWISFENPNFKPDKGKVIFVDPSELTKFQKPQKTDDEEFSF